METSRMTVRLMVLACALLPSLVSAVPFTDRPDTLVPVTKIAPASATAVGPLVAGDSATLLCKLLEVNPGGFSYGGTGCWGWEHPDGTEYAIMGIASGVAFVNATTGAVAKIVLGPTNSCGGTRWREMRTYKNYCYVSSECTGTNQGILIIDMLGLPNSIKVVGTFSTASDVTCHALAIDTAKGYLYAVKSNYSGFRVISLANPEQPVEVGFGNTVALHDITAHNDTVWAAEANQHSWSIWNLANHASPQLIKRVTVPSGGYVHNIWPSRDRKYLATTEETAFKTVKFWDVQDLNNIQLVGNFLGPSNMAHNIYWLDSTAFLSHYESGVFMLNVKDPANPVVLGQYDTHPNDDPQFLGTWGGFPYTRSGKAYGSNLDGRLFVFQYAHFEFDDTLYGEDVATNGNNKVRVNVSINNSNAISRMTIPFTWAGTYNMTFDSFSTQGLRTGYFNHQTLLGFSLSTKQASLILEVTEGSGLAELAPGSGPVVSLWFTVPGGASGPANKIRFVPLSSVTTQVSNTCFTFQPDTVSGSVFKGTELCCVGTRGNADNDPGQNVDITDLQVYIDYLFLSGQPGTCATEFDLSADGTVDITDLQGIIDFLFFSSSSGIANCP